MHDLWTSLQQFIQPETLLKEGGIYVLLFVIFAETGLLIGFFLPGDYLLFLAGMFAATQKLNVSIIPLILLLIVAAIIGNFTGYWFGKRTGPMLYQRKDSFFFKQKYLVSAEKYYRKQGAFALIMGRFIPIVRTFAPICAGVVNLDFKKFAIYNITGAILWISSLTLLGYLLGKRFEKEIQEYLFYIIIGFVSITSLPLVVAYFKRTIITGKTPAN